MTQRDLARKIRALIAEEGLADTLDVVVTWPAYAVPDRKLTAADVREADRIAREGWAIEVRRKARVEA